LHVIVFGDKRLRIFAGCENTLKKTYAQNLGPAGSGYVPKAWLSGKYSGKGLCSFFQIFIYFVSMNGS